jgi:hypothetical protein
MPPADPAALRALLAAATPGPWTQRVSSTGEPLDRVDAGEDHIACCDGGHYTRGVANAALAAAAVTALPGLLDERDALRAALEKLVAASPDDGQDRCAHCGGHFRVLGRSYDHASDCPWALASALLAARDGEVRGG